MSSKERKTDPRLPCIGGAGMKPALVGVFVNFCLAATKCTAGFLGHSFALITDGLDPRGTLNCRSRFDDELALHPSMMPAAMHAATERISTG